MPAREPSRIPFDPRDHHVLSGLARWMSLLGRFQIVAAVFLFVLLLAVAGLLTTAELLGSAPAADVPREAPLVSIGEVSRGAVAGVVAGVVAFTLLFLRGGMLLVGGAEDLEAVAAADLASEPDLEEALRKIRNYFVLESVLMVAITAATYAATILEWGA